MHVYHLAVPYLFIGLAGCSVGPRISRGERKLTQTFRVIIIIIIIIIINYYICVVKFSIFQLVTFLGAGSYFCLITSLECIGLDCFAARERKTLACKSTSVELYLFFLSFLSSICF